MRGVWEMAIFSRPNCVEKESPECAHIASTWTWYQDALMQHGRDAHEARNCADMVVRFVFVMPRARTRLCLCVPHVCDNNRIIHKQRSLYIYTTEMDMRFIRAMQRILGICVAGDRSQFALCHMQSFALHYSFPDNPIQKRLMQKKTKKSTHTHAHTSAKERAGTDD